MSYQREKQIIRQFCVAKFPDQNIIVEPTRQKVIVGRILKVEFQRGVPENPNAYTSKTENIESNLTISGRDTVIESGDGIDNTEGFWDQIRSIFRYQSISPDMSNGYLQNGVDSEYPQGDFILRFWKPYVSEALIDANEEYTWTVTIPFTRYQSGRP